MEGRNFHTALFGGFRKKDVISYLAEEKRLQEAQMEELRREQAELERQLDEARTAGDADRSRSEELQGQVEGLHQQLELARADLDAAREAQLQAEERLAQAAEERLSLEERLTAAGKETQMYRTEGDCLRAELEQQKRCNGQLEAKLAQLGLDESCGLQQPLNGRDSERLRAELAAERQRVAELENQLRQLATRKEEAGTTDQLWALCGKMERTISQMERMLDGPYHVTCYPDEPIREREAAPIFPEVEELPEEPAARPVKAKPSVSSLLQRVRGK